MGGAARRDLASPQPPCSGWASDDAGMSTSELTTVFIKLDKERQELRNHSTNHQKDHPLHIQVLRNAIFPSKSTVIRVRYMFAANLSKP